MTSLMLETYNVPTAFFLSAIITTRTTNLETNAYILHTNKKKVKIFFISLVGDWCKLQHNKFTGKHVHGTAQLRMTQNGWMAAE
jgi:hypothetical protein